MDSLFANYYDSRTQEERDNEPKSTVTVASLINESYLKKFKVQKPAKNENRKRLIQLLADASGWTTKSIHFQTLHFKDEWLEDALKECRFYSNPKLRNLKLKEFLTACKAKDL